MEWKEIYELMLASGPAGLGVGLAVLLLVYAGTITDIFKTPQWKRWAAILSTLGFAEVKLLSLDIENVLTGAIGLVSATFLKKLIDLLVPEVTRKFKKAPPPPPPPPPAQ
jgi:hypothetical protein